MRFHHRPIKTVITGKSGSGKTTYFTRLLENGFESYWKTIFVYDWQGEISSRMGSKPTFHFSDFESILERDKILFFEPSVEYEGRYEEGLLAFSRFAFESCKADSVAYPRIFACDEIQLITDTGGIEIEIQTILQTGRRAGLDMAVVAQQLNELHNKFRAQSTERVVFQHEDPRVLDVMQDWGFDPEAVSQLKLGQYLYRNDRGDFERGSLFNLTPVAKTVS